MSFNTYDLGTLVRITSNFSDPDDEDDPIDPAHIFVSVLPPEGDTTTYEYSEDEEVTREESGEYTINVDANAAGDWYYRWFSTGTGQAAKEKRFAVRAVKAV